MEGNSNIDALMMPVLDAINRHVKDRDAKTDIYNRAYEALLISMDVNAALREQVRWRKYPEEMPKERGWYPTWEKNSIGVFQDDSFWTGSRWQESEISGKVLFWMLPLPQPPEAE